MNRNLGTSLVSACTLASMCFLSACSSSGDKDVSGGTSGDMGIVADIITGDAQKGPFVKGSAVTVQGIDCKTMTLTDEHFEGVIKSDMGDFAMKDIALSSSCAVFEVTGQYRDELTGKKSAGEITLHALTNLKGRKTVNVNVLTELEYERVMNLVTEEKMDFADAKKLAEKEVLATFGIQGDFDNSEDLTIFESGDGNAALLAVSVMMRAETDDAGLATRIDKFTDSFVETGKWKDDETKSTIESWQVAATADGTLDSIRKNVEGWGYADVVPAFEKYVEAFGEDVILSEVEGPSSSSKGVELAEMSSGSESVEESSSSFVIPASSEAKESSSSLVDSYLNPNVDYGEMTDSRDGQVYKTVKIGNQVWMAENLNYEIDSSFCYNDSAEYCAKYGRLYRWATAVGKSESECGYGKICSLPSGNIQGVCPSGWHMPSKAEWDTLFNAVGGQLTAGKMLKSTSDWIQDGNGTDEFGFSVLPSGYVTKIGLYSYAKSLAYLLSSTEFEEHDGTGAYVATMSSKYDYVNLEYTNKSYGFSVRCLKNGSETVSASSSSSSVIVSEAKQSSSSRHSGLDPESSSGAVDSYLNPNIDYGEMTDSRDGQVYKTIKVGNQVWMAENLNFAYTGVPYKYEDDASDSTSWCYDNDPANCTKYGRLYTWSAAMDSAGLISIANKTKCGYGITCTPNLIHQGVCPGGWHIPTVAEWKELFVNVGGTCNDEEYFCTNSGAILKSSSGWYDSGNGSDDFGFSVIPSGWYKVNNSINISLGNIAYFWTAMEYDSSRAYSWNFIFSQSNANQDGDKKTTGLSVRCVRN